MHHPSRVRRPDRGQVDDRRKLGARPTPPIEDRPQDARTAAAESRCYREIEGADRWQVRVAAPLQILRMLTIVLFSSTMMMQIRARSGPCERK